MSLADRTIGGFPVAIATSLALETLFEPRLPPYDPDRQIPEKGNVRHYQSCWINLATLYRNLMGAIPKEAQLTASPRDVVEALEHEVDVVSSVFEQEGQNACQVYFYTAEYPQLALDAQHHVVEPRSDKTPDQLAYTARWQQVLRRIRPHMPSLHPVRDVIQPDRRTTSLIITHVPADLLAYPRFERLVLLESHTGKLKSRGLWYTKYHELGKEPMHTLPFYKPLLYLFGDHSLIRPTSPSLRRLILEISRQRQWTPMTQWSTVRMHLESNFPDQDFLARLFKVV